MRDIHSFNICPKASHGSKIHWTNMLQKIQWHPKILEEQMSSEELAKIAKPMAQAAKLEPFAPVKKRMRDIHSFNICPKASHGSQIHWTNMLQKSQWHQKILEEQTSSEELAKIAQPMADADKLEPLISVKKRMRDIHSFNICPKASHGSQIHWTN